MLNTSTCMKLLRLNLWRQSVIAEPDSEQADLGRELSKVQHWWCNCQWSPDNEVPCHELPLPHGLTKLRKSCDGNAQHFDTISQNPACLYIYNSSTHEYRCEFLSPTLIAAKFARLQRLALPAKGPRMAPRQQALLSCLHMSRRSRST